MIQISITAGELLDRASILYIKNAKFKDKDKLKEVEKELKRLLPIVSPLLKKLEIDDLYTDLMGINFDIWELKDRIKRIYECGMSITNDYISLSDKQVIRNSLKEQITNLL